MKEFEFFLAQLPIAQYVFFKTDELTFSDRVRKICEEECPRYAKSWACPPGVGSVEACKAKCLSYPEGLMLLTLTEVDDISDMEQTLATRAPHEKLTHQVAEKMRALGFEVYGLSTESCALCQRCTYPHAPCKRIAQMFPCVESHGILATALLERYNIDYLYGNQVVTWVSLLLYR